MNIVEAKGKLDRKKLGHGPITFPKDHVPGLRVPKGGSSCASCEYLGKDRKTCTNTYFIRWNGNNILPAPPDEFCSDYWEPRK